MRLALFLLVAVAFLSLLLKSLTESPSPSFSLNEVGQLVELSADELSQEYRQQFASSGVTREVHSAVMVKLGNGNLRAFWYGGAREGAKDVSIYTAELDLQSNEWLDERVLVERHATAQQLGIYLRKIGNPVTFRDGDERLWLFFVSVSVGGWAGSTINFMISDDDGQSWTTPKRLIASPLFNLSTLVKGEPFLYTDGSIGLPVYHEMIGKFGELIHLSSSGEVLDKVRLMSGRVSLQPIVLPSSGQHARIYMRNATDAPDSTLFETWTTDAGESWAPVVRNDLPNPNAAITGLRLDDGGLLLVINNQHDKRNNLSLMHSVDDGDSWQFLYQFEQEENTPEFEHQFAYPSLRQSSDGDFHVVYTWNKERIKHIRFNQRWLQQRMEEAL
ncbi:BNR/Asp-box repeat protein [gamma proteobacterium IMCC2047]|nr:BNR/Asp-box repeat protein [gamma proteobacterium IMCC2047]